MADQNITALPVATAPASSDQLLLVGATEEKLIDYDKLADAILQKLTSKTFTLDQGAMTLLKALNELNSNTSNIITVGNVSAGSVGTEFSSIDEAAQYIFDNKIPISENKLILVNFTFGYQYCMIVQKYYEGKWGAYILFGCNVPSISYHVKTDGEWK